MSVDDRHVTAENRLVSWLALWNTLTGFVSITKFPPFGASLPLYKEEQLVVDSKTPVGNGMPVVSLLVLFSNYVYVHPFRKIYDNFSSKISVVIQHVLLLQVYEILKMVYVGLNET